MKKSFLILLFIVISISLWAKVTLPSVIGSNMVLQRNDTVALWGKATPGSVVKVNTSWDKGHYKTKAAPGGKWSVNIITSDAGGPYNITITDSDNKSVVLDNVMLGEVWICSGQSNMEMPVKGFFAQPTSDPMEAVSRAGEYPSLRLFTVPKALSEVPQDSCGGQWLLATPKSVGDFSATAFYFGRALSDYLGIPVGLINVSYGGSAIEEWMTREAIDATPTSKPHKKLKTQQLWNAMLTPIVPFTARGFIWYQGESNRMEWMDYAALQKSMIELWRKTWNRNTMPFYITQIAQYVYNGNDKLAIPLLVNAQYEAATSTPLCAVAATTDIGNPDCIHPAQKRQVGDRLAWLALQRDYKIEGLPAPAPTYKSMEVKDSAIHVHFYNAGGRNTLAIYDDNGKIEPGGFEIAGDDQVWYPAKAEITKDRDPVIIVSSPSVPMPVAVRYAFHNVSPAANVHTVWGQPLAPFRTDTWPIDPADI